MSGLALGWLWDYASDESTSTTSTSTRPSVPGSGSGSGSAPCSRSSRVESNRRSWLAQASWVTVTDLRAFQFPHDSLGLIRVMYAKQAIHDPRSTIDARSVGRSDDPPHGERASPGRQKTRTCGRCTWTIHGQQSNIHSYPLSCPVLCCPH